MSTDLHDAIRAWARGVYPLEAGAELLIRSGWADRLARDGWVERTDGGQLAYPDARGFQRQAGYLSGGEQRQLAIIVSLLGQKGSVPQVSLHDDLPGVDRGFIRLVMSAVGHAAGLHESGGNPLPWPEEAR